MPNITTNHAITYTYDTAIFLSYLKKRCKTLFSKTGFFLTDPSISLITLVPQAS